MWVEDVVVDETLRGRSLGRRLVEHAIEYASRCGKVTLMLTSRPSREAANALYRSSGFSLKETNVYKKDLP
jgi:ribosomal protein S18 acetylase RimI-like enzyme